RRTPSSGSTSPCSGAPAGGTATRELPRGAFAGVLPDVPARPVTRNTARMRVQVRPPAPPGRPPCGAAATPGAGAIIALGGSNRSVALANTKGADYGSRRDPPRRGAAPARRAAARGDRAGPLRGRWAPHVP